MKKFEDYSKERQHKEACHTWHNEDIINMLNDLCLHIEKLEEKMDSIEDFANSVSEMPEYQNRV